MHFLVLKLNNPNSSYGLSKLETKIVILYPPYAGGDSVVASGPQNVREVIGNDPFDWALLPIPVGGVEGGGQTQTHQFQAMRV